MPHKIDREELRLLIREALREALGAVPPPLTTGEGDHAKHGGGGGHERRSRHLPHPPSRARGETPAYRLESGLLTEAAVGRIAGDHQKIVIGDEVVVTPLARDRARILKVEIVRQKP